MGAELILPVVEMVTELVKANNLMVQAMTPEQRVAYYQPQIDFWTVVGKLSHQVSALLTQQLPATPAA